MARHSHRRYGGWACERWIVVFASLSVVVGGLSSTWNGTGSDLDIQQHRRLRGSRFASSPPRFTYRDVPNCRLIALGQEYKDDKFVGVHTFGNLYCEVLRDFRRTRGRKLRMLEIGFGCGHINHGASAQVWKTFFTESNGPGLQLYEVEYGGHEPTGHTYSCTPYQPSSFYHTI